MKNRFWIMIIIAAAAVCLIIAIAMRGRSSGHVANIYKDGECIRSVDLSKVNDPFSFTVSDENGHENTVEVENGKIRVVSANCPDQICVNMGWISDGTVPIVCMPARLSVNIEDTAKGSDIDAIAG